RVALGARDHGVLPAVDPGDQAGRPPGHGKAARGGADGDLRRGQPPVGERRCAGGAAGVRAEAEAEVARVSLARGWAPEQMTSIGRVVPFPRHSFARPTYAPVSVSMRSRSPSLMKPGTCTTRPVSRVAGLRTLVTVAVFIPGVVSTTFRSTVFGRLTPIGVV